MALDKFSFENIVRRAFGKWTCRKTRPDMKLAERIKSDTTDGTSEKVMVVKATNPYTSKTNYVYTGYDHGDPKLCFLDVYDNRIIDIQNEFRLILFNVIIETYGAKNDGPSYICSEYEITHGKKFVELLMSLKDDIHEMFRTNDFKSPYDYQPYSIYNDGDDNGETYDEWFDRMVLGMGKKKMFGLSFTKRLRFRENKLMFDNFDKTTSILAALVWQRSNIQVMPYMECFGRKYLDDLPKYIIKSDNGRYDSYIRDVNRRKKDFLYDAVDYACDGHYYIMDDRKDFLKSRIDRMRMDGIGVDDAVRIISYWRDEDKWTLIECLRLFLEF